MSDQFAYAQWPWGTKTREEFIKSCADISAVGFRYFESVRAFVDTFKGNLADFKAITDEYDLHPISFYFHHKGNYENDVQGLRDRIEFVAANNIKTISVQGVTKHTPANEEDLRYAVDTLNAMADICKDYGITPCVHPHYNSTIMYESDIDYVMRNTDPDRIGFGPDTAHLVSGNCDPATIIERYKDRIKFMHLKDITGPMDNLGIDESIGVEVYDNFRELGEGIVDFKKIFAILKSVNYKGYLCAELDRTRFTHKESAAMSLKFLKENW